MYNLYLDDYRQPKDSFSYTYNKIYYDLEWVIVRSYDEFVKYILENGLPQMVSFDHDLADEHYDPDMYGSETYNKLYDSFEFKTGYDCAKWMIKYCMFNKIKLPAAIHVHSMNPAGKQNIKNLFDTYYKYGRI